MSRTDKDRPYHLKADDPYLKGKRYIRHDHLRSVHRHNRVPVTWGGLLQYMDEEYSTPKQMVAVALLGHWRRYRRWAAELAGDPELKYTQRRLGYYLQEQVELDPGDELADDTVVGYAHDWRWNAVWLPCDYRPDNNLTEYRLPKPGRHRVRSGPEYPRCKNVLGLRRTLPARRQELRRQMRRQAKLALRQAEQKLRPGMHRIDKLILEPEPDYMRRNYLARY